jgi:hypothetical protein
MDMKYTYLPVQDLPKFTQIWIFGLKIPMSSGNPGLDSKAQLLNVYKYRK